MQGDGSPFELPKAAIIPAAMPAGQPGSGIEYPRPRQLAGAFKLPLACQVFIHRFDDFAQSQAVYRRLQLRLPSELLTQTFTRQSK